MYTNEIAVWNRNRDFYFKIGLIAALLTSYAVINLEITPVSIDPDVAEEYFSDNSVLTLLAHHEEIRLPQARPRQAVPPVATPAVPVVLFTPVAATEPDDQVSPDPLPSEFYGQPQTEAVSPPSVPVPDETKTVVFAEEMPYLQSCGHLKGQERTRCTEKAMLTYIYSYLKYPPLARDLGIQGTVILSFVIDKTGKMGEVTVTRDIGGGCGPAAAAVVKNLGTWTPGYQNQKAVNVKYTIPIKFVLQM